MPKTQDTWVRWLIRRDMPRIMDIERLCFDQPWSEDEYVDFLRQRNGIGMVAEFDGTVAGVMLYTLEKKKFYLANLAVHPDLQRRGIGRILLEKLVGKLNRQARTAIELCIRETNLPGQKFFQRLGFRAIQVVHGLYEHDELEDAYLMLFDMNSRVNPRYMPHNRVTSLE